MELSKTKESKIYSDIYGLVPTTSSRGNKYIYVIYVYEYNAILTTATNHISYKEMIRQSENLVNNILAQTSNPELAQYLHAALFGPTTEILVKAIRPKSAACK